jgi:dTDP-4-amino-4,6-dideoxygalactose transaminase
MAQYVKYNTDLFSKVTNSIKDSLGNEIIPVLFESEKACTEVFSALEAKMIYARRYFYPSLNTLNYVINSSMPVAEDVSKRILCLPSFFDLTKAEIDMICRIIIQFIPQ